MCCLEMEGYESEGKDVPFSTVETKTVENIIKVKSRVGVWVEGFGKTVLGWVRISV